MIESADRVKAYFYNQALWVEEQNALRTVLIEFPFSESIKWRFPTYSYNKTNLIATAAYKNYFGLWFFEGAKLDDLQGVLSNAQPD